MSPTNEASVAIAEDGERGPATIWTSGPERRRAWWICGLDLAGGGRLAVAHDVTDLAEALETSNLSELFQMTPAQLLATVLSPVSFSQEPTETSPVLATVADTLGVAPASLIASCLVAHRARQLASDLTEAIDA
jgi:hypothetical protein